MLAPVLAKGPHVERPKYDLAARATRHQGDLEISEVGRDAKMPWEQDGRRWHTRDRVGRSGAPCRWDGRILERIVDQIQELGDFSPTDWHRRTIVEIAAPRKSDGWFLHANTGEEWLVGLKFRVARNSFRREMLVRRLDLKPLNDMAELPIYGREPRVKCKNLRGPWQEISLRVHSLDEIDHAEFWSFLEEAVAAFKKQTERRQQRPEDVMPWKVLGKKWHLARKGFPLGKKIDWPLTLLERLFTLLERTVPDGNFEWTQQQVVHLRLPDSDDPWITVFTKRRAAVELMLAGPKGAFALGRVARFGFEQDLSRDRQGRDLLKLRFRKPAELDERSLSEFLREHALQAASSP